jgi:hypothetical protein
MKNRIASLFELDELLSPGTNGHSSARAQKPGAARRAAAAAPAVPAPARRSGKRKARRVTQNADKGEPIRCDHAVPYKPVPPVDVQPPAPPPTTPPAPTAPPPPTAQQLGDEYDVESFEETDEDSSMRLTGIEETELDESYLEEAELEDDKQDESTSLGGPYDSTPEIPDGYYERRPPDSFAAQMTAVERDLADLASRVSTPAAEAPSPGAPGDTEESAAAPAPPPPERRAGHAVFDEMAQGMAYATEFRLPAVQLSQVFSALDRELDAEQRRNAAAGPMPPPQSAPQPGVATRPTPTQTPIPDNRTLIADLVAMPAPPTGASPVEETTEPDDATTA